MTELFHLADDSREQQDVSAEHPEVVQKLLEAYQIATRPIEGVTPLSATGPRDLELERALEALGYLGGDDDED